MVERPPAPIVVAISDCLLGNSVRFDGTHAAAELAKDELDQYFRYQGICPEVGIGMQVPRPPIGLFRRSQGDSIAVRQLDNDSLDLTAPLEQYARQQLPQLRRVSGYIFMQNSPSCGLFTVKVHNSTNPELAPQRSGRGVYAAQVTQQLPLLPVEENERLFDPALRHNFLTRTFAYAHWLRLQEAGLSAAALVDFHSRYKYLLMAHSQPHYRQAGQVLSQLKPYSKALAQRYIHVLMDGLSNLATRAGHINVLHHLLGYLKLHTGASQRQAVTQAIDSFASGEVELQVPLALTHAILAEHLEVPQLHYAWQQIYFEPYPLAK